MEQPQRQGPRVDAGLLQADLPQLARLPLIVTYHHPIKIVGVQSWLDHQEVQQLQYLSTVLYLVAGSAVVEGDQLDGSFGVAHQSSKHHNSSVLSPEVFVSGDCEGAAAYNLVSELFDRSRVEGLEPETTHEGWQFFTG
jgi:hypothetical protein